jgi:hypothetical protein
MASAGLQPSEIPDSAIASKLNSKQADHQLIPNSARPFVIFEFIYLDQNRDEPSEIALHGTAQRHSAVCRPSPTAAPS